MENEMLKVITQTVFTAGVFIFLYRPDEILPAGKTGLTIFSSNQAKGVAHGCKNYPQWQSW